MVRMILMTVLIVRVSTHSANPEDSNKKRDNFRSVGKLHTYKTLSSTLHMTVRERFKKKIQKKN